ncbi:MAG TPA: NAD-dependent epimerase/dehydratase family protein [Euzebyales bacterium]
MTRHVLVTGGGGVVGGAVVRALLARGVRVRSLARGDYPALRALGVETVRGDVADLATVERAVAGCDAVIHTAAKADMTLDPRPFVTTNIVGTANVVAACRRRGVPRLVHTSTPSVVDAGASIAGGDESLPYQDHHDAPYPQTKARAERLVLAADGDGLATVALRPHLVWGPGDTQLTARVLSRARAGRLRLIDHGTAVVDATYIDDAAAAHVCALDALDVTAAPGRCPVAGRAFFVGSGHPLPIATMINGLLDAAGLPPERRSVPFPVAFAAGAACEALWRATRRTSEPPITRFLARQQATDHWFDLTAARRDLGYVPHVTPDDGFRRLAAALQMNAG